MQKQAASDQADCPLVAGLPALENETRRPERSPPAPEKKTEPRLRSRRAHRRRVNFAMLRPQLSGLKGKRTIWCRETKEYPMPSFSDWKVPTPRNQKRKITATTWNGLHSVVGCAPSFPATPTLRKHSARTVHGNGVFIRGNGLVLTIGYLITEAKTIWINLNDGRRAGPRAGLRPGNRFRPGSGARQARRAGARDRPSSRGHDRRARCCRRRRRATALRGGAHRRQTGIRRLREYVLDEAIFTAPSIRTGRHRTDWTRGRSHRHRLAAIRSMPSRRARRRTST